MIHVHSPSCQPLPWFSLCPRLFTSIIFSTRKILLSLSFLHTFFSFSHIFFSLSYIFFLYLALPHRHSEEEQQQGYTLTQGEDGERFKRNFFWKQDSERGENKARKYPSNENVFKWQIILRERERERGRISESLRERIFEREGGERMEFEQRWKM